MLYVHSHFCGALPSEAFHPTLIYSAEAHSWLATFPLLLISEKYSCSTWSWQQAYYWIVMLDLVGLWICFSFPPPLIFYIFSASLSLSLPEWQSPSRGSGTKGWSSMMWLIQARSQNILCRLTVLLGRERPSAQTDASSQPFFCSSSPPQIALPPPTQTSMLSPSWLKCCCH